MDGVEHHGDDASAYAPMRTSVDKLADLAELIPGLVPEDERQARMIQALMAIWPHAQTLLPQDPDRLDELLLGLAHYALIARSDGAELPTLEQLLTPEVVS